ncbi:MAG TPA: DNA/RNA helicase domain-containing protein, partial [Acetobacteraceae bacterium]
IDEAQRCWSAAHAVAKTVARRVRLHQSEPAHLLDIMQRRPDGAVIICLIGGGQEIHDGEGGLAEWGEALRARPAWRVLAPEGALAAPVARQRLPCLPGMVASPALNLTVPVRSLRCAAGPAWVDAVLANEPEQARRLARDFVPFSVTRDLATLRACLRRACRGDRRAGLLASSGARRLRAEGLGATLPHDDPVAVARWFLDRFPDVRASDALEVAASEFFVQGLELDAAGLCWDGDLVRTGSGWAARAFRGTAWTRPRAAEKTQNRLNAYRVLLTRARYETVIWVPRGDAADPTRDPRLYDAVADYLLACGARMTGAVV